MRVDVNTFPLYPSFDDASQSCHPVMTPSAWYLVWSSEENADIYWSKSSNKGLSWTKPVSIKATTMYGIAIWYDGWTPGDSGTRIHFAYLEDTTDDN